MFWNYSAKGAGPVDLLCTRNIWKPDAQMEAFEH